MPARQPLDSGGVTSSPSALDEDVRRGALAQLADGVGQHGLVGAAPVRLRDGDDVLRVRRRLQAGDRRALVAHPRHADHPGDLGPRSGPGEDEDALPLVLGREPVRAQRSRPAGERDPQRPTSGPAAASTAATPSRTASSSGAASPSPARTAPGGAGGGSARTPSRRTPRRSRRRRRRPSARGRRRTGARSSGPCRRPFDQITTPIASVCHRLGSRTGRQADEPRGLELGLRPLAPRGRSPT